jgi:phenylacetate-CoA ligase
VLGRTDDLLIVKGVKVYPAAVKNLIAELVPLASGAFRILLDEPGPRVVPPLRLTVERGESVDESGGAQLARQVESLMHQRLSVRPAVEIVPCGTFERAAHKETLIERRY